MIILHHMSWRRVWKFIPEVKQLEIDRVNTTIFHTYNTSYYEIEHQN